MKSWMTRAITVALLGLAPTAGLAQETEARVATNGDWSVFKPAEEPVECFGVSAPRETVNTKDGAPVSVRRGDILMFVTFRPGQASGEISFSGGYPFAAGSTVNVALDATEFEMITDGEWAWPATPEDDAAMLEAMKKGSAAVLTAHSAKGTQTMDTFSLSGFTASMEEAAKQCQ